MPTLRKQQFEEAGFVVTERVDARKGRMFTYIRLPNGLEYKWFGTLADINRYTVDSDEYVTLDINAWPLYDCPPPSAGQLQQALDGHWYYSENDVWNPSGELLIDPFSLALLVTIIALMTGFVILMLCIYSQITNAPCGDSTITNINECWKIIRAPDCSHAEFNACGGPDNNGDGKPDGEWAGGGDPNWQKDVLNPADIVMWVAIAALAIGGTYIAVKLLTRKKEPQYPPPQYYPPQQYRRAPGIEYVE